MLPRGSEVTMMDVFYIANSQLELPATPNGTALILPWNNEN